MRYRLVCFAAFLGLLLCTPRVRAETSATDRATAEALFREAGQLFRQGKYDQACSKLASSQRLDPAVGTLLNLGRCYEKVGKTASAWLAFVDAASAAKTAGQREREETARQGVARLEPLLPKLLVQVPDTVAVEGLSIQRDHEPMPKALWNVEAPTDPGDHALEVRAPNKKPWSASVHLAAGQTATVSVPPLVDLPGAEQKPAVVPADAKEQSSLGTQKIIALTTAGVGVAGLVVGTVFGLGAKSDADTANASCGDTTCPDRESQDANERAHKKATLATVFMSAGGALVAGGIVLWFTAPSNPSKAVDTARLTRLSVTPVLERDTRGVLVGGSF